MASVASWRVVLVGCLAVGCTSAVKTGLPALVDGCRTAADCAAAGPAFQCLDGGCGIQACLCDDGCPPALGCCTSPDCFGLCEPIARSNPCDAGPADAGPLDAGPGYVVHISMSTYVPETLTVPAGATVTFINEDSMQHSATSEAVAGAYRSGAVDGGFSFDTRPFSGTTAITIPAGIAPGTVQPYFCTIHTARMKNPNPTLVIQ